MVLRSVLGASLALAVLAYALHAASAELRPGCGSTDAPALPSKPTLPDGPPGQQVQALSKQYDDAQAAFRKLYEAAKTDAEQAKVFPLFPHPENYAPLLLQIAEQHPGDPAAVDALLWIVQHTRNDHGNTKTPYAKARAALVSDHLMNPKIGPFCLSLRREEFDPQALDLLRQVLEKHPDKSAQAQAVYALAKLLQQRAGAAGFLQKQKDEKQIAAFTERYGAKAIADLKRSDPDRQRKDAEALLERLTQDKDYAATVITRGEAKVTLGELAERELFELRHLVVGKPAPEITGEDIDGKPMKLSDFRGQVVLLDFWGHW